MEVARSGVQPMRLFPFSSALHFAVALAAVAHAVSAAAATTPLFADAEARGRLIALPDDGEHSLDECSGLVASRRNAGVLWTHNDSFDTAVFVMTFDTHAHFLRRYKILNQPAGDFEDIALGIGPEPGVSYVYLGNIGDNAAQKPADVPRRRAPRPNIKIHRFREPSAITAGDDIDLTAEVTTFTLQYPDGPHNAESLMIDPEGNLYIVIKEPTGLVFGVKRETLAANGGGIIKLEQVATVCPQFVLTNLRMGPQRREPRDGRVYGPTAADISPDGSMILIKSMWESFIWYTRDTPTKENPWSRWAATLSPRGPTVQEPRESLIRVPPLVPDTDEPSEVGRGEAIAFSADGNGYYTAAEGKKVMLYYYAARTPAPESLEATITSTSHVSLTWRDRSDNETGFSIERRTGETGDFVQIGDVGANMTTFESLETPPLNHAWKYRVRARTPERYSAFSAEAMATRQISSLKR